MTFWLWEVQIMTFVCIFLFRRHVLMAFATPSNPSTKGTSNYAQLCRLLVEVGSHVLKEIFDRVCPPEKLHTVLTNPTNCAKLQTLRKKRVLCTFQWRKLYPAVKWSISSENFDSSLLLLLLRNIFGLTLPASGQDDLPLVTVTPLQQLTSLASRSSETEFTVMLPVVQLMIQLSVPTGMTSKTPFSVLEGPAIRMLSMILKLIAWMLILRKTTRSFSESG